MDAILPAACLDCLLWLCAGLALAAVGYVAGKMLLWVLLGEEGKT